MDTEPPRIPPALVDDWMLAKAEIAAAGAREQLARVRLVAATLEAAALPLSPHARLDDWHIATSGDAGSVVLSDNPFVDTFRIDAAGFITSLGGA